MAVAAGLAALLGAACGGGSPNGPSSNGSSTGSPGPVGATITIGANGAVNPGTVTINVGQSVAFVNNHTRSHEMASNQHPSHLECPPMNVAGVVSPGQTKNTNAFSTARTCGFHDHSDPDNPAL